MHGKGIWVIAAACLAVTALLITGCGGGDSSGAAATSEGDSSTPLTKKEFVDQANQVCEQGLKEKDQALDTALQELAKAGSAPTSQASGELVEEVVLPPYRKIVKQLDELDAPTDAEPKIEAIVGKFESALEQAEAEPAKAASESIFTAADHAAEDYGLQACRL